MIRGDLQGWLDKPFTPSRLSYHNAEVLLLEEQWKLQNMWSGEGALALLHTGAEPLEWGGLIRDTA